MTIKNRTSSKIRSEEREQIVKIERYCSRGTIDKTDKNGFILELHLVLNKDFRTDHFFFPKLEKLNINGKSFKQQNVDFLNLHEGLKELWLTNCQLDYIPKLNNLKNLQTLRINGNNISSLSGMEKLTNLRYLLLSGNKIQNLNELEKLSNLNELNKIYFWRNGVNSLEGIGELLKLPNLKFISFAFNNITSLDVIEQLANHESLEELILENNEITELNISVNIPNLKRINLNHNKINKITALKNLPSLERIKLSYNDIRTLENLNNLPNLKEITVACNPLKTLTDLKKLPSLELVEYLMVTEWEQDEINKLENYLEQIGLYSHEVEEEIFLDDETDINYETFLNIYSRKCITEFKVNKYLSLKLMLNSRIGRETMIYVDGKPFIQCSFLLFTIPTKVFDKTETVNSIDEAAKFLNPIMERGIPHYLKHEINPEEVFWGHCSNIQAWAEHGYDTRLLHRNLAFPLLKKLTEAGDPMALKVFKEEIAKRYSSGIPSVRTFLSEEGYLRFLSPDELDIL